MASQEMVEAAAAMRAAPALDLDIDDIETLRVSEGDEIEAIAALPEDVSRSDFDAGGVPARHVATPGVRDDRGILYFHGGGYVAGSLDSHTELMGRIARACRAPVLGIDYRLAPEDPYPAAVDDAVASYERLLANGIDAERIVIAGDSSGGGLTVACLLALKTAGKPMPAAAMLVSPWTDLRGSGASMRGRATADPMLSGEMLAPMAAAYAGAVDLTDPGVSPLFGDLTGLPPLLIQVGDDEVLLDDSTRLAERAETVGVSVRLHVFEGAFRVFQMFPTLPESREALEEMGRFFDAVTA